MGRAVPEVDKFTGHNFYFFRGVAMGALVAKDLGRAISGDHEPPQMSAKDDQRAKNILIKHVKPKYQQLVAGAPSARAAWELLEAENASNARLRAPRLLQTLRMGKHQCVSSYYCDVLHLQYDLAAAGCPASEQQLGERMLGGLRPEYEMFRVCIGVLQYKGGLPPLSALLEKLLDAEAHLETLEAARVRGAAESGGDGGGGRGGGARNPHKGMKCHHCGKLGHIRRVCRKLLEAEGSC